MTWKTTLAALAAAAAGWLAPVAAQQPASTGPGHAYPAKPIRIVSPFAPGGGNDVLSRAVAQKLTETLRQQVIVENRPGANGIVGTEVAARAVPDGYTIVLIPSGHTVNPAVYRKLPYDSIRDFTPISLAGWSPLIVAVHPSLPVRNVKDLVAFAKGRPGQVAYGTAGVGSSGHLAGAQFELLTGVKLTHIPYKGMGVAITDIIAGQVSLTFGTNLSTLPHVRSGRLRGIAVTSAQRTPALPDLPTVAESGVPGYEASLWYGFVGPARLAPEIVQKLNAEIVNALKSPDVRERLASQGVDPRPSTPEELSKLLVSDQARWAKVVERAGVKAE